MQVHVYNPKQPPSYTLCLAVTVCSLNIWLSHIFVRERINCEQALDDILICVILYVISVYTLCLWIAMKVCKLMNGRCLSYESLSSRSKDIWLMYCLCFRGRPPVDFDTGARSGGLHLEFDRSGRVSIEKQYFVDCRVLYVRGSRRRAWMWPWSW